ncbi:MAG: YopX family protein [Muribaculaceae bacterium]|nr:YopX family protein [Muribaculaceae bacterium]
MQDRFKFRVWQTELKYPKMKYNSGLSFSNNQLDDTDCVIMQCTGLKDKNGKLAYFDDLVKNKWGEICKVIMQTDEKNYGRIVLQNIKFLDDEFNKDNIFIPKAIEEGEIIGNIYQNPELLEGNPNAS